MALLGIDYSVQSPAICVHFEEQIHFYFFPQRKREIKFSETGDNWTLKALPYIKEKEWKSREHRYDELSEIFMSVVNSYRDDLDKVGIEGYSLNSRGRAISIACEAGAVLRHKLYQNDYNVIEYAPTEIKKKFTGRGNAGKHDMYNSFLGDKNIESFNPYDELELKYDVYTDIKKPVEDIVDAYAIVHCLRGLAPIKVEGSSRVKNLISKI